LLKELAWRRRASCRLHHALAKNDGDACTRSAKDERKQDECQRGAPY
jgi:hypothetical protein